MAVTLEEIRRKYPNANYAPRENCKHCKGTGERTLDPKKFKYFSGTTCCICIFVDHSFCDEAATMLGETAKKLRQEMAGEQGQAQGEGA